MVQGLTLAGGGRGQPAWCWDLRLFSRQAWRRAGRGAGQSEHSELAWPAFLGSPWSAACLLRTLQSPLTPAPLCFCFSLQPTPDSPVG